MTYWMLLSCLYLFVARMLRSWRDSLTLAVIFMSLLALSQRSTDVWVGPVESCPEVDIQQHHEANENEARHSVNKRGR